MARNYAQVQTAIWQDADWRALSATAQLVYLMLLSQPDMTYCGVVPLTEKRWASNTAGLGVEGLSAALEELEAARFVMRDEDSEELLVRSFLKHNGVLNNPKLRSAMLSQMKVIHSQRLRAYINSQIPSEMRPAETKPLVDCGTDPNTENQDCGPDPDSKKGHLDTVKDQIPIPIPSTSTATEDEFSILAKRALAKRSADMGAPADPGAWLATVERGKRAQLGNLASELRIGNPNMTPTQIADELEPPPPKPRPSVIPRRDCETCEGSAMVMRDDGTAERCPDCATVSVSA